MSGKFLAGLTILLLGCTHTHGDHGEPGSALHRDGQQENNGHHDQAATHHGNDKGRHTGGMHPHHDFSDAKEWSKRFDDPARSDWQKPDEIVRLMNIQKGDVIADIGAGTGYMLPFFNAAVGETGQVYGLDVEENLVRHMSDRIRREKLAQTRAAMIPFDSPELQGKAVTKVFFLNTWHHIGDRSKYVKAMTKQLANGARVYLVEPEPGTGGPGPSDDHRMTAELVMRELAEGGFSCRELSESLPYQYMIRCDL